MTAFRLSSEGQKRVVVYLQKTAYGGRKPKTLDELLVEWVQIVDSIQLGYKLTIYDYQNDLDYRAAISEVEDLLSGKDKESLQKLVAKTDQRFVSVTNSTQDSVYVDKQDWWYFRIPKIYGDEMEKDLRERGFLK